MKNLICCSLDINIPVQSNAAQKRLFDRTVEAIDYYYPVQSFTPTKSVFLWLAQLTTLVDTSTNLDRIKSKSLGDNCSKCNSYMSNKIGGKELMTEEELVTKEEFVKEEELVTEEELITENELLIKEKLEMEEKIETEDLKGSE